MSIDRAVSLARRRSDSQHEVDPRGSPRPCEHLHKVFTAGGSEIPAEIAGVVALGQGLTVKEAWTSLPDGLSTYHEPPSWSIACPVITPAFVSRT